ncbi:nuclear transport factor 2 family protein [Streptomyces sp. B93]|uniref:nuclear transport factor 2 family protein n=1 Tax=Streptomyces sp. B93 TaxID=2824875 RepID=UPI001B38A48D|nr:nuclear transport factor 2 family protein [Streptomyces sp. B93]MBQ1090539.1 nuclear transport factor 2 family protein [Streptomyces sp. B93]
MPTPDLPPAIRTFIDATNRADSAAFVTAFTPDAHLNDWGRDYRGRDGVADWDRTDNIGVQARFEPLGLRPGSAPDTWDVRLRVTGNGYNGTGRLTFRLRDGLIADLRIG